MPIAHRYFRRHGFTLIELLIVISIIVLALSLAVPTINVLQGNRSLETAQNDISAYLGVARSDAMYNRQSMGVCFYIDPVTQQTGMVEVAQVPASVFVNTAWTTANPNAIALDVAGTYNTTAPSLTANRDVQLLPKGVSVALYNAPASVIGNIDHLVRMGIIMFDQYGNVTSLQYGIPLTDQTTPSLNNALAAAMGSTNNLPLSGYTMNSSPGIVLYDHELYLSQDGFNDADFQFVPPSQNPTNTSLKTNEENWIAGNISGPVSGNGISLMVNQSNGTLVKGK